MFEAGGFDVVAAISAFRAQAHLEESERPVDVVVVPWDAAQVVGGELYRWALAKKPELRTRFVFIAEDVPPEFDAVVGGRCLAVPLVANVELVRVAHAIVRRTRTPSRGMPVVVLDRPTLLLVDDDPVLLAAMAEFLDGTGYSVFAIDGGRAAQEAIEARDYDAIVTDWQMHDGSGADLYRWIASEKPHLCERVVFLSETADDDARAIAPGRPMLRKGQDSQALAEVLRWIVKRDE
ncbi:MAG TPA: response regulator [Kofleriaceae bacterium]|nr:response regulator [Kofleriaceae bacterium]